MEQTSSGLLNKNTCKIMDLTATELKLIEPNFNLTLCAPISDEENLNFYFHTSLWCLQGFYEGLKGFQRPS